MSWALHSIVQHARFTICRVGKAGIQLRHACKQRLDCNSVPYLKSVAFITHCEQSGDLQELKFLDGVIKNPQRPLVAIVGGSKVSSKITVLESLIQKVDKLILG